MIFYFPLYNKEAPKDELNLISGQSNLDVTERKKKHKWVAYLRPRICEFTAAEVKSYGLILAFSVSIWHFIDNKWKTELCSNKIRYIQSFSSGVSINLCYSSPLPYMGVQISSNSPQQFKCPTPATYECGKLSLLLFCLWHSQLSKGEIIEMSLIYSSEP